MLVISSREFRQHQRKYFDKVDQGEQIIVQRGKDKSYILTPIGEDDMYFHSEMIERMKKSLQEAQKGEVREISSAGEIRDLLGI